jgi:hypothetical protein
MSGHEAGPPSVPCRRGVCAGIRARCRRRVGRRGPATASTLAGARRSGAGGHGISRGGTLGCGRGQRSRELVGARIGHPRATGVSGRHDRDVARIAPRPAERRAGLVEHRASRCHDRTQTPVDRRRHLDGGAVLRRLRQRGAAGRRPPAAEPQRGHQRVSQDWTSATAKRPPRPHTDTPSRHFQDHNRVGYPVLIPRSPGSQTHAQLRQSECIGGSLWAGGGVRGNTAYLAGKRCRIPRPRL